MSGTGNGSQAAAGMTASWVAYAAMMIVGILSLFSLYMGFQNYATNQDISIMYMVIGSAGFAAIGYLFFRGRAMVTQQKLDVKKVEVFTTLECPKCQLKRVRDFKRGDYVFKNDEPCTRCDGMMVITKIARKKEEEKKQESTW
jgi:hypothetical protein